MTPTGAATMDTNHLILPDAAARLPRGPLVLMEGHGGVINVLPITDQ